MAQSCTANDLATAAACFMGMSQVQLKATQVALLCNILNGVSLDCTANNLADAAKCYMGMSLVQLDAVIVILLCQLSTGGGGSGSSVLSGTGSPSGVVTPDAIGQLYSDPDSGALWQSTGLTNLSWQQLI